MEKQFSQKWTATATGTPNQPSLCLRPARPALSSTLRGIQDHARQNSGDPSLPGVVAHRAAALLSSSTRARARSIAPLDHVC